MMNIYTTSFHPESPDEPVPWYEIVENEIYTTLYHPTHPQEPVSWYVIRDQEIFTSPDHPTHPNEPVPWFEINKNLIYPSEIKVCDCPYLYYTRERNSGGISPIPSAG